MRQQQIEQIALIIVEAYGACVHPDEIRVTKIVIERQNRDSGFTFETGFGSTAVRHESVKLSADELDQAFRLADTWS